MQSGYFFPEKNYAQHYNFILRRIGRFSSFLEHLAFELHDFFTPNQNFKFLIYFSIIKDNSDVKKSMDFHWFSLTFNDFLEFQWIFMNFGENTTCLQVLCGHLWWCWDHIMLPKHVSVARGSVGAHWESPMMTGGNAEAS